jgi:hypothetical protein
MRGSKSSNKNRGKTVFTVQIEKSREVGAEFKKVLEIIEEKKLNVVNAFETEITEDLRNIQEYVKALKEEKKWLKSGEVIGACSKVYSL